MPGQVWIALGKDADGARAYGLDGSEVVAQGRGATEKEALQALNQSDGTIVRVGDGAPDVTPCPVLSTTPGVLPALSQTSPPAVLGGWTRLALAGYLARHENWDGVICVPECDVTHWVHLSANEVVSFASFLTLRLNASLGGGVDVDEEALRDSQSRPERLAAHLREAELAGAPAAITGHLIGAELAAARVFWLGQQVVVMTSDGTASPYSAALSAQGVPVSECSVDGATLAGLTALGRSRPQGTS